MNFIVCRNCRNFEAEHLPNGACLFEPTYFAPKSLYIIRATSGRFSSSGNLPQPTAPVLKEVK